MKLRAWLDNGEQFIPSGEDLGGFSLVSSIAASSAAAAGLVFGPPTLHGDDVLWVPQREPAHGLVSTPSAGGGGPGPGGGVAGFAAVRACLPVGLQHLALAYNDPRAAIPAIKRQVCLSG